MNPLAGSFRERLPRGPASTRCIANADFLESSLSALLMDVWQLPHDGTHSSFVPPMDRGNTWSSCSSVLILPHQKHPAWVRGSAIFSSVSQFRFIWTHGRQLGSKPDGHRADQYREVGLCSAIPSVVPSAFLSTNPTDESITSGLPVTRSECHPSNTVSVFPAGGTVMRASK